MIRKNTQTDAWLFSQYLDGELSPSEREIVEKRLRESEASQEELQKMRAISSLIRTSFRLELDTGDRIAFDDALKRRLQTVDRQSSFFAWLAAPFLHFRRLSWQWQAAVVMSLFLLAYAPFLLHSSFDHSSPLLTPLESDFHNVQFLFDFNPKAGYDFIWVITDDDDDSKKTDKGDAPTDSSIGLHRIFRA